MVNLYRFLHTNLKSLKIASGTAVASLSVFSNAQSSAQMEGEKTALDPKEFRSFTLEKTEILTPTTKRLTFSLPSEEYEMGITVASCLLARADVDGKSVIRPYTPTNLNNEKGFLELTVKGYPNGKLSKHITHLQPGDTLEMKGPFVKFNYEPNQYDEIGLIAGGSGVTPMIQLIKQICRNPEDHTKVTLLYGNVSEDEIINYDELNAFQHLYPDQFKVYYFVSDPKESEKWNGYTGYITKEKIQELLPGPSDNHFIGVCGPPPMMYSISGDKAKDKTQGEIQGALKELNYTSKHVFKY